MGNGRPRGQRPREAAPAPRWPREAAPAPAARPEVRGIRPGSAARPALPPPRQRRSGPGTRRMPRPAQRRMMRGICAGDLSLRLCLQVCGTLNPAFCFFPALFLHFSVSR